MMDQYSLHQFFKDSQKPKTFVILRKIKGIPIAVIELTFHQKKLKELELTYISMSIVW